jgi:hypothetical protein
MNDYSILDHTERSSSSANYSVLDFLKTFGINTKTNFDLKEYADYLNLPIKVLMNDELYKISKTKKPNVVINIQNSDKQGSHWVCFRDNQLPYGESKALYFDSFGIRATKEVEDYLPVDYIYNKIQVQPNGTKICGVLCLYVLYQLKNNY